MTTRRYPRPRVEPMHAVHQHAQPEDDTPRRREFLSKALNDLNATVLSLFDVPDHLRSILGDACTAIGASAAFVQMKENGRWRPMQAVGVSEESLRSPSPVTTIAKRVRHWRDVMPLDELDEDVREDVRRLGGEEVTSALAVPLTVAGRVRGVVVFLGGAPFDELAQDFARKLATSVSLALHAAELFEAEERRVSLAEALDRINRLVHARLDPEEVLAVALDEGCSVLGGAGGCVAMMDGEAWTLTHQRGFHDGLLGLSFRMKRREAAGGMRETKEPVLLDPRTDERFDPRVIEKLGISAVLAVPIVSNDDQLGVTAFTRSGATATFTSAEMDFARRLGASSSLAYENALLYQAQLESARLSGCLNALEEKLHSTLEFDELAHGALALGLEALGADSGALLFRDEPGLRVAYAQGDFARGVLGLLIAEEKERHGMLALRTRQTLAIDDTQNDERCDAEHLRGYGIGSVVVAPLIVRDEPIANLYYNFAGTHRFTTSETEFVTRIASSLSLALQNAQQYAAERTIAQTLQEALLALPSEVPGVQVSHMYQSAALQARVGGDFYDVFELDQGLLGLVVGDVSGKGLDAAVLTALVKNTVRAHAVEKGNTPSDVLARVNTVLLKESRPETFVTIFFGMLDRRDGRLVYCNAGHPAAVVLREDGLAWRLAPNSPIAGAFANAPFGDGEAHVGIDDLLFLYTDGLTEARRGRELYGEERLFVQLARACETGPDEAIRRVVDDVIQFAGGQLADDVAVLAVKRVPLPSDSPVQQKLPLWSVR